MQFLNTALQIVIVAELAWLSFFTFKIAKALCGLTHGWVGRSNYCIWSFRDGSWQLMEDRSEPGFQPGEPPARAGSYPGETVRQPAVRRD